MIFVNALHIGIDDHFSLLFFSGNKYINFWSMIFCFGEFFFIQVDMG
ncbi:hypothetical protein CLV62_10146 [Dysgonomonas alginatilytica]|uniref:Uncharacterized protein n=1 Tax=Dysgonomonas alginatilytica TaxID=1605892 RepID=A0A2V3PT45_9BACT|nr:hypothetical protein CLV62_10146 [Dysgonomonas alginatilytica]